MLFCEKEDCKFRSKTKCKNFALGDEPAYNAKLSIRLLVFMLMVLVIHLYLLIILVVV
jgi:hypothetical protein